MDGSGLQAAGWGLVAGSSFVIGGIAGLRARLSERAVGLLTAIGAGALLAAVSFKLVDEAGVLGGGSGRVGLGLILGSVASLFASGYWSSPERTVTISFRSLAVTVIPEAIVIVGALLGGHHISGAMVASVFLCGVPEAFRATAHLRHGIGLTSRGVIVVWCAMAVLCGASAGVAYVVLDGASEHWVAFVLALAAGAVLTELTTELIPDARHLAGPLAGPATVTSFGVVFALVEVL